MPRRRRRRRAHLRPRGRRRGSHAPAPGARRAPHPPRPARPARVQRRDAAQRLQGPSARGRRAPPPRAARARPGAAACGAADRPRGATPVRSNGTSTPSCGAVRASRGSLARGSTAPPRPLRSSRPRQAPGGLPWAPAPGLGAASRCNPPRPRVAEPCGDLHVIDPTRLTRSGGPRGGGRFSPAVSAEAAGESVAVEWEVSGVWLPEEASVPPPRAPSPARDAPRAARVTRRHGGSGGASFRRDDPASLRRPACGPAPPPASPPPHAPPLRHSPPRLRLLSRGGPVAGLAVVLGRAADLGRGAHSASVLVCPRPRLVFVRRRAGRQPAERAIAPGPAPLPSGLY